MSNAGYVEERVVIMWNYAIVANFTVQNDMTISRHLFAKESLCASRKYCMIEGDRN